MPDKDPLWYKDAIIYEVHVRAFQDSSADGIGDFRGLTERLDYLQDLGVTAIWLLPFYPSPLRDDGYDIADYTSINPAYGTMRDFKQFVRESHRRGLRVITELVCNHTSDQHPWFQRARQAPPGSAARNFYVWSHTTDRYKDARIIFKDFETSNWAWDPVAKAYYWHRFYSHQPDLNYENPQVRKAIFKVMDTWLEMGIDGLRLDAVPYLYEEEGTNCENLPQTHDFLKSLRRHVDENFDYRMLLAEANQWPEDAVTYLGDGDECHMAFHFPVMPRMFMSIRMEDRFPIIDILAQTPPIPETAQWALFLRNHDELTLEMVTDEERDYMYRVYARDPEARINLGIRRRLAPLLGNHRRRIELMNGLLFSLPGTPVLYYGDEIGMGDNIYLGDRNGVRTPMQWSADRNAGFSQANPQRLYLPVIVDPEYHYETVNVQAQHGNPHSLLSWTKRLISLRKQFKAFGRGTLEFLYPENRKVLAFVRRYQDETILVVANLSRFVQYAELNLGEFKGMTPVELWGQTEFPPVRDHPYFLTLGPHAFYWFSLQPQHVQDEEPVAISEPKRRIPTLTVSGSWESGAQVPSSMLQDGDGWGGLRKVLPSFLQARRWFRGKARRIKSLELVDAAPLPHDETVSYLAVVQIDYTEGDSEDYLIPMAFATGKRAEVILHECPQAVIARLKIRQDGDEGVLYDALMERTFSEALLRTISQRKRLKGARGEMLGWTLRNFKHAGAAREGLLKPSVSKLEQSNTSVVYGDQLFLKLFRKLEPGVNPDLEMGRFLTERSFPHIPPVVGVLEYVRKKGAPMTAAMLQHYVQGDGDAWEFTLQALDNFMDGVPASGVEVPETPTSVGALLDLAEKEASPLAKDMVGSYLDIATLIGQRTAEMHLAISADQGNPGFAPEPFTSFYQRSIYQNMRSLTTQVFQTMRKVLGDLPEESRRDAELVLGLEQEILERFRRVIDRKISAMRIRCHGDYHLGQLLRSDDDFVITDFEGEPIRPLSERRIKRSALRDVSGMLRSFYYAAATVVRRHAERDGMSAGEISSLQRWAQFWNTWVSSTFLKSYLETARGASFIPASREELEVLLDAFLLEKAVYEIGYELNNRPTWASIPIQSIPQLLDPEQAPEGASIEAAPDLASPS
jgi:maltose alpha-D-glucosyltransferase / alpha-amylase